MNSPVLKIASAPTRSAFSTAHRNPIAPPQSCTTTIASLRSSPASTRDVSSVWRSNVYQPPVGRLVRSPEPRVVGNDHAIAGLHQWADHLAVQVGPARLTVKAHDRPAAAWPLVDVVHSQTVDVDVVRREVVAGQILEAFVRRPEHLCTHDHNVTGTQSRSQPAANSRSAGNSSAKARPRCDCASFSAGVSSAAVRDDPEGRNTGS